MPPAPGFPRRPVASRTGVGFPCPIARGALTALAVLVALSLLAAVAAATPAVKSFDLPAGDASRTLKLFSEQSGEQIIYPVDQVRGIHTHAVKGELVSRDALEGMLAGTGLTVLQDKASGALSVRKQTANAPPPDRPQDPPRAGARQEQSPRNRPMNHKSRLKSAFLTVAAALVSVAPRSVAQTAPSSDNINNEEETFVLSPFIVESDDNANRYKANSTLAGTRVRTDLRDIASPLSVVTAKFMQDLGAHSNQDLLKYTTNTEVGGIYGNYGGFGNQQGLSESGALVRPSDNTRVRGLEQADGTRNFFLSDIPWDSYNTDRIDLQRGPNSILFGVGSPAGIINASTIVAGLEKDEGNIANELSSYGSVRFSLDYNKVLVPNQLAIRFAALDNDRKFRQKPAFNKDQRIFGTVTYQPQVLPKSWASPLTVRASAETGKIKSNNPRVLPPTDGISLWFDDIAGDGDKDPWGMQRMVYDPYLLESGRFGNVSRGLNGTVLDAYYIPAYSYITSLTGNGLNMFFRPGESNPQLVSQQGRNSYGAIGPDGKVDNTITSIPFASLMRSAAWNNYAYNVNLYDRNRFAAGEISADQIRFPLAERNYYKDRSLTDPTIFDFYNHLIDGDNKREQSQWTAYNIAISQTFLDHRFGFEFVYDNQSFKESRHGVAFDNPYIAIDTNANLMSQFPHYDRVPDPANPGGPTLIDRNSYSVPGFTPTPEQRYANPNAGAAFVSGGANGNYSRKTERETERLTVYGEFRATDVFDRDSLLAKVIGRHVFTGLSTAEERTITSAAWRYIATDLEWARSRNGTGAETKIDEPIRQIVPIVYLSGSLVDRTSAHGLNLDPVKTVINPWGRQLTENFKSSWLHPLDPTAAGYVDPAAPYTDWFGDTFTQSENPANYVGSTMTPVYILNASKGEVDQLYTDYTVLQQNVDSTGLTWQGHLLGGNIVPTWGWRRDKLVTYTGSGAKDPSGVAATHADVNVKALENVGETISWGIVGHLPAKWAERLPVVSGLSAYYNRGRNNRVEARYNFDGEPLANPSAESTDYGVVVSLLDDRLTLKIGRYETKVKNGNLPGGASLIGDQQYYINQLEAWGTASALMDYFGYHGLDPNQSWYWNWANIDDPSVPGSINPLSNEYRSHPSTIRQQAAVADFIAGMDQQFYNNYQIPIDVAKLQAAFNSGDPDAVAAAVAGVFPVGSYTTGMNSNGQINGITPNGTIDNTSKGYEFELNFAPTPQWNIQVNASKTTAYRESLGAPMREFITQQYARYSGPAGDLRLWWGGDSSIREYYENNIISALTFQEESVGSQAPELRPWRFALITNYGFEQGWLKGVNVGGAWRWEDSQILGYRLKDDRSGLDVHKPIMGQTESAVDVWIGYTRKLNERFTWRTQLNLRNVGKTRGLVPISANPDGSLAAQRIVDGMTWALTNSLMF